MTLCSLQKLYRKSWQLAATNISKNDITQGSQILFKISGLVGLRQVSEQQFQ